MDDNLTMYAALVGTLLPPIVAKINRADMTPEQKALVALVISLLAAAGTAFFNGDLAGGDVVRSFLIVFTLATVTYQTYWKPSGIAQRLERHPGDIRTAYD